MIPGEGWRSIGGLARLGVWAGAALAIVAGIASSGGDRVEVALIPLGLGAAVFGLVLLEQVYRNTRPERRWAIKFLLLGVGGLLAYDLFLYSHALLLRGIARSRARVFIAKHFYANRYDYRDDLGSRTVRALAQIVEAAGGVLWVRRERAGGEPRWEKLAGWHADGPDVLAPGDPLLDFMRRKRWSVQASGVASQRDNYESLVLPGWITAFGERALAVPLLKQDELYGVVVLRDPRQGLDLDYQDIDLLRTAADRQLTGSRQFEAYNRLTAFLMHDLKNLIAQQSLVVRIAAIFRHDPEFIDDAIATVENSVQRCSGCSSSCRAALQVVRLHQRRQGHGHRRLPGAPVCRGGWGQRARAEPARGRHLFRDPPAAGRGNDRRGVRRPCLMKNENRWSSRTTVGCRSN